MLTQSKKLDKNPRQDHQRFIINNPMNLRSFSLLSVVIRNERVFKAILLFD
jgi:hypothetical protein